MTQKDSILCVLPESFMKPMGDKASRGLYLTRARKGGYYVMKKYHAFPNAAQFSTLADAVSWLQPKLSLEN